MGIVSRTRKGQTGKKGPSAQINAGALQSNGKAGWSMGGVDNYDGRANTQAGDTQGQSWERKSDTDGPGKVVLQNG